MAIDYSKAELGLWQSPKIDQASYSKGELGVWLIPNDNQTRYAKVEIGIWLELQKRRAHLLFASF